jgi:hypothetical protein
MLLAGNDDGVYRIDGVRESETSSAEKVLDAGRVVHVERFDGADGLFAASESGLFHSSAGSEWTALGVPEEPVYAVTAASAGERLYAGTRPARVFVADLRTGLPDDERDWEELDGFRELRERADWGIPRHDGRAQVRSLCTHPDAPDRIVAGVEVGGVHVSEDGGESWTARQIEGFDAPHTDDIHHIALADEETLVASTGSGLFRSPDAGRTWDRLDTDYSQRYFREAFAHDGRVYAGGAPASSASWEKDDDHALFEAEDGRRLDRAPSPVPDEVAIGWCAVDGDAVAATHGGTLIRRDADGWRRVGNVPTSGGARGRYMPLAWYDP